MSQSEPRDAALPGVPGTSWRQRLRTLVVSLPAVLIGGTVVGMTLAATLTERDALVGRYLREMDRSWKAKDYPETQLCADRLMLLGDRSEAMRYRLALALEAQGETQKALDLIVPLAPLDRPGYAPAQLWAAIRLLRQPKLSARTVQDVELHAKQALAGQTDPAEARALLGQLYAQTGRPREAVPQLAAVVSQRPDLLLMLAGAYASLGDPLASRTRAETALKLFKQRTEANPDDLDARLRWASAAQFLEDYPRAEAVLKEGLARSDVAELHRALAALYLRWSQARPDESATGLEDRLALLEKGLNHDPSNTALLDRFLAAIRAGDAAGDRARQSLRALVAEGRATGLVQYVLGIDAWERGQEAEARLHWEQACAHSPQVPVFANNLAYALAFGPTPDLARALETINPVIARWPDELRFRETRGQILVRMRRYKEALPDLQAALKRDPTAAKVHAALAEVYENLQAPEMAAEHRRRAAAKAAGTP